MIRVLESRFDSEASIREFVGSNPVSHCFKTASEIII
jgi:hypothetical protein